MEGNEGSKRVLEKCGFERFDGWLRPVFVKQNRDIDDGKDDGNEKEDDEETLTEETIDELKSAIAGMNIQTKPSSEPVRADTGIETMPMEKTRLVRYQYYRNST